MYIIYDGKFIPSGDPIIPAGNRGLRYGDGLFETFRFINDKIPLVDEHFARLWQGMQLLGFSIPVHFTPEMLIEKTRLLLQKNKLDNARVRLTILRGNGGLYDPEDLFPHFILETFPLPEHTGEWNSNGLEIGICESAIKSCDIFSNCKHNNFLPYLMAAMEAKNQKWNDALVLNQYGRVCDSTIANLFLIKGDIILTPSLTEGCVAGVMRKHLLGVLRAHQFNVQEKGISVDELMEADEVFLTNAIRILNWVGACGKKRFDNKMGKEIFSLIRE